MQTVQKISTGYHPRPLQDKIHKALQRFNVMVCHRRFGKTVLVLNDMIDRGLRCTLKNPQYAYIAPTYGQAKRVAWEYLKDYTKNLPGREVNEAELRVDIHRPGRGDKIRFILLGAENPTSLLGMYLDGVILDEYAQMSPIIWTRVVRPMLSDRMGWAHFIGTPQGENHFYEMLQKAKANRSGAWFWALYKASETNLIAKSELQEAKESMSPEEYEQEFECSFSAALVGAYYGKQMEELELKERITTVDYDTHSLVDTAWDLGIDDSTAIWCLQQVGREIHVIDYIEDSGMDLAFYVGELNKRKYAYQDWVLPHDAAARELQTGQSRERALYKLVGKNPVVVPRHAVADRIEATRNFLARCWFDKEKCARGIAALKNYERSWDAKNKIYSSKPKHNWASHAADAFGIYAMGRRDNKVRQNLSNLPRRAMTDYDVLG